jgi:amino acid adenylation domain-containing protein
MRDQLERELIERAKARLAAQAVAAGGSPRAAETATPGDGLEQDVLRLAAAALRMPEDRIDPDENLANYGVDSIAITEIMSGISRFFGVSIAPTTFFEARHLKDLAQILRTRYGAAIAAHYAAKSEATYPEPVRSEKSRERTRDVSAWLARHRAARPSTRPTAAVAPAAGPPPAPTASPAKSLAEPVAIIGMEGMFPKSPDLAEFEAHLAAGRDCIEEIPPNRWDWRAVDGDPRRGPFSDVKHGGFIPGHDLFDAAFFNISPKEAELMDPQHRLFIECVWKLIEGAGHAPGSLSGRKVSLFLGINLQDYADLANRAGAHDPGQLTGLGHIFCANRLSFLLDINGPSQVIDTACSSSLVALHRAVQSIRHEGCEMAIAGGANLMLTPTQHILFARVGMLARDGRCKTFSRAANGYARAEGIGALLLKRLDLAERDGDRILGVIRGSAENHGGAASSLTAPNPRAQARLIAEAHRQAGIDPRTISYMECHGTGTALGDPVEIEGLKAAFAELREEQRLGEPAAPYCGLGSVKSNIGHTETAAGIAGVIKVLLGLRAGKLWQSLHCEEPNPLIDLRGSPFYLLDAPRDWTRIVIDGHEVPRRAGVSSFGAGGANAHVLIEECRSAIQPEPDESRAQLIPLSARNETALREAAARLAAYLASEAAAGQSLADIAHTLQSGRDAMRVRLACVVHDKAELRVRLETFAADGAADRVLTGVVERKARGASYPGDANDLSGLAAHWIAGGAIEWAQLHRNRSPHRVALPTYPFQRRRFWLPETATPLPAKAAVPTVEDALALEEILAGRFRVRLRPDAFFLRDHVVAGAPTLPGVVYLELMRRAVLAAGLDGTLGQLVWLRPLLVTAPIEIEIAVLSEKEPQPRVEIFRVDADGTRQPHAQARVLPRKTDTVAPRVDTAALAAAHPQRHSAANIYATFDSMGIAYGPAHRAITSLARGVDSNGRTQVFGRLHMPAGTPQDGFVLHPSLMDGAFQCALGMALNEAGESAEGAALPFALDRVEIFGPCLPEMAIHIRTSGKGEQTGRVRTLDLDLMDMDGGVRVRMQGFATRKLAKPAQEQTKRSADQVFLFAPHWRPITTEAPANPAQLKRRFVLLCDRSEAFGHKLAGGRPNWSCRVSQSETSAADGGFSAHAAALLVLIQEAARASGPALLQVVISKDAGLPAGLAGFLRTAQQEVPHLTCQLLALDPDPEPANFARRLEFYAQRPSLDCIREEGGTALAAGWRELEASKADRHVPWRDGAVYLITGGYGGLGQLFAREIASRAAGVTIILASRKPINSALKVKLVAQLSHNGSRIEHAVLDVSDADAVTALVSGIRSRHGSLDGVLHAAGLLDDGAITGKTPESLAAVLAPKVTGVCNLDRALGAEPLDLFLLFGSISGALGNPGQADYAAANAFLDAFAAERETRRRAGLCHGRTLSVDWQLWRDGGMRMSPEAERLMTRTTGLTVLETKAAFSVLYDALGTTEPQVLVVAGDQARIEARVLKRAAPTTRAAAPIVDGAIDQEELERKILSTLSELVSAQLKVSVADLTPDAELSEYGFDSISFTQFANALNDRFSLSLTPTVFFEHPTLGELAAHFAREHATAFASTLGVLPRGVVIEAPQVAAPSIAPTVRTAPSPRTSTNAEPAGRSPIAIIGMSGAFPDAADPEALWQNLLNGHDAIREAPSNRWDRAPRGDVKPRGGFIDGIGEFDAAFFGLSAPEARIIDPQQRLLLTHTWRLLEDAGYAPRRLWGANVGVFVGIADTGYGRLVGQAGGPTEGYAMTGLAPSVGPNRVSFHFNFNGPSVAVETACSSALVAIHRAAEAIHSGDCTAAIAGGVNALLSPETFEGFTSAGMLARDGRSKTFSADADGYGRGEGIGLVLLKRLDEAERDGDRILAVIRGSAENHGGRANSLTAPNPKAQAALLVRAYERAGFDPRTVSYIETHGTGTPLGDPIEVEALNAAFTALSADAETRFGSRQPMACGIGSVKSNIGHLELAAGAAGLIKVLLQMRHGTLAASLHCRTLNPYLKLEGSPFHVVRETSSWRRPRDAEGRELPRRAGVSAFGFGGSNAHLVLEEYIATDERAPAGPPCGPVAVILSARSEEQLAESARQLHGALAGRGDADLTSIAFTLQTCREAMEYRLAFLAVSINDVRAHLAAFVAGEADSQVLTGRVKTHREMMALLDSDTEVRHALSGLGGRGRHDILMGLWLRGFPFNWRTLYGAHAPPRADLPGYPFARTVHWVRPTHEGANDASVRRELMASAPTDASALPPPSKVAMEVSRRGDAGKDAVARALDRLTAIAARLLETETSALEPDTELGEFGFDSITMTRFATKVNDELGLSLTPADFFEFATLSRLARHVAGSITSLDALEVHSEASAAPVPVAAAAKSQHAPDDDPIAIVGMSCTFPGAPDTDGYWNNLVSGVSSIGEIPADRWDWREFDGDPKLESNKTNIRFGGFIDGVFEFDPLFFGISPREAKLMDPQQRLMMTHAWKALEDAGHAPRSLAGQSVGLFVGTSSSGYSDLVGDDPGAEGYAATGSVPSVGPNRISYALDWHGPSEPVETACSSALVAMHRAMQAMRAGDCDIAVAGGVNTIITPEAHINFAKAGMLSVDGACKTFSAGANGYVRGEGVGMLVLKRLSAAERDGDAIYAIVRGTAINHGGRANSFTAPNTSAQADVITRAYAQAGIDPATIGYIETHGTGTALGDPVEINALKSAFSALPSTAASEGLKSPGCGLGSAKTNIGHLELAAGVAGVIKVLLQLRHRTLAPTLNSEPSNPYIELGGSPFFIVREAQPWRSVLDTRGDELPRRAGVSSFGFGGVNAHVVLEEYVDRRVAAPPPALPAVVPLSARDDAGLAEQVRQLLDYLNISEKLDLADVAFTLQAGRTPLKHRAAFVVQSLEELKGRLVRFLAGDREKVWLGTVGPGAAPATVTDIAPEAVAAHWVQGGEADWKRLDPAPRRRLHLPTYPFARDEYRAGPKPHDAASAATEASPRDRTALSLDPDAFYLRDHRIAGAPVLPGAMTLELARAASGRPAPLSLSQIVWLKPVSAATGGVACVVLEGEAFRLLTGDGAAEVLHAQGRVSGAPDPATAIDLNAIRARCPRSRSPTWLYDMFAALGMEYGPAFRSLTQLACGRDEVLARLSLPFADRSASHDFVLHPSMIDGALQACLALFGEAKDGGTAMPFALERVDIFASTTTEMWAHVRGRPAAGSVRKIDIDLADGNGAVVVRIIGFSVRMLPGKTSPRATSETTRAAGARYLIALVAAETGVPVAQIELSASLDTYGIDSVMIVRLTDELEKTFGPLPKTLFFEHRTLDAVLAYFLEHHADRFAAVTGKAAAATRSLIAAQQKPEPRREADLHTPIAIVGLAGRYPGARDLETFWDNLAAGRDCITEVPLDRWDHTRFSGLERGEGAKWGGFVDGVAEFDPLFFNISPREAPYMDPQERLFLQCAHEAIEDAGYTRASLAEGDVGVFVGVMWEEYQLFGAERTAQGEALALSSSPASIANRVSSVCDFHGPSMAVDSMCSSSLSAIHLACESLALGACTAAIAGGVNLSLHPNKFLALMQGRFLSSSGRCESFGAGGDGYVPGEGVGAVVLKRLDRAVADGDHIYGVIRGSALNHGGKTNGYTVPNPQAQTAVIRRAIEKARVEPRQISYVEAHGTGTKLGDPIEITALSNAYRAETPETGFCAIGSVKSNIGHCESAAGIAGLTKVLLQMKHRRLAPSLHSSVLNPGIDFGASPFSVQRHLGEWRRPLVDEEEMPRVAGLSSFGAGGSNAHLIIEEYDAPSLAATHAGPFVFPFSARDEPALDRVLRRFLTALETINDADFAAAAHVLQLGREAFEVRAAIVAADLAMLRERLYASLNGEAEHVHRGIRRAGEGEVPLRALDACDLETIARAWTRGAHVDWQRLWRGAPPRRISLPTYPFAREIYWVPGQEIGGTPTPVPPTTPTAGQDPSERQPLHSATALLPQKSEAIQVPPAPSSVPAQATENLKAVTAYLATEIAAVLNVPADKLDVNETFDRYGLDSISALDVIDTLEARLGEIPKTLLFEYPTVAKLAGSLMETHAPALRDLLHEGDGERAPREHIEPAHSAPVAVPSPAGPSESDIAIIAVAGRYPGADTPEELWEALCEGRDLITEVPEDRWDIDAIYAAGKGLPGKTYCRWGGFLSNVDAFDAAFFGISPREAALMDPQERLFLETAWHVLERGGYPRRRLQQNYGAKVGVFVGAMSQQYRALDADNPGDRPLLTLTSHASLANRVSYFFDLQGPSVAVDSMCSSGLEAVHLACQALRRRECKLAIAGAVNLTIHPDKYIGLSEAGLVGSRRDSRAFSGGDGYLPAEGVGAVLLKPLSDALADCDVILGVIKCTAVNHSGRSAGYGVPSAEAQRQLIEDNFREAGIDPRTVGYVEAAATGAALGDAIEVRAMTRAFRSFTADTGFCAVGSVKASMGHAEAASGLAQLTKCLFQLQHRTLAPRVSVAVTDPDLEFEGTPFVLQKELAPWQRMAPQQPLRAAISSFGAGGTNVHLILEEAPPVAETDSSAQAGPWRFPFSAQCKEQLGAVIADMARYVSAKPDLSLSRLSWTLRACRERLACTAEIVAADWQELLCKLTAWPVGGDEVGTGGRDLSADGETGPPLILPDYPFARTRHWIAAAGNVSSPKDPRPDRAERTDQRSARRLILELLAQETGLQFHVIPPTASFRDLGAASIFALRLIRAVADELNVEITNRDLEIHETVDALTALIEQRRDGARSAAPDAPTPDVDGDLSEGQLGLWVLQKLYPDMSTYNVPLAFRIERPDTKALQRARTLVLERFPILARRIVEDAGTPRVTADAVAVAIADVLIPDESEEAAFLRARTARPFDLSAAPPIRFELIRRLGRSENAIVLIVAHHIAIDGLSATILARTFWEAYTSFSEGRSLPSSPRPADFQEFAAFESAHLESAKGKSQLTYWKEHVAGELPVLDLPADRPADPSRPINAASFERRLAPDLARAAQATARKLRVNRPAFFLAVLNILLHRYTAANDILVGMPVMGRPARRFEDSVGCFANMMVMRTAVSPNASAAELIAAVQTRLTKGLDNAAVPYAALVRELGRSPLDGPLYQVSFAYQNFFYSRPLGGGAEHIDSIRQQGGDMLGIEMFEVGDSMRIVANYDAARFDAARIDHMVDHFITLAAAIAAAPHTPVSALDMLTGEERERILGPWAAGGPLPEIAGTVLELIAAEADRRPNAIALVAGSSRLTYREVLDKALGLADYLAARGVKPGDRVAVLLERSAPAIVALLGVLSAAAVYVPLDGGQPDARLAAILADAEIRAVIVDDANEPRLADAGVAIPVTIQIDRDRHAIAKHEARWPRPVDRSSAGYIIYTSGSTGRPKGVVVSHGAIADHCQAIIDLYGLGEDDRVLQFSSLNVDPSLEQILTALICGASLVMREDEIWTPAQLSEVFEREAVTVADLPPAYLAEVLAAWEKSGHVPKRTPRLLICGGEALTTETVRLWRNGPLAQARLINAYGPTEATITALSHEVTPADLDAAPIGRPLPSTSVYVLDPNGQPVPEGVPGELYIGGSRLALGYVGNEDMTRERFVPNPFGPGRLYRTGDRVAFIPGTEGHLAFVGRVDSQVKIRGFRVELGEVEAALAACGIGHAVVIFRDGSLVAFVAADEAKFNAEAIAAAMAERLPGYMCPASYVRLDALPLTPAGKVDRTLLKTLAPPAQQALDCGQAAPLDAAEERMIGIWRDVFGESEKDLPLGRDSDFFALGGHSLLAVRLLSAIERAYGQSLSMADLIAAPTVADQVRRVSRRGTPASSSALVELRRGTGAPLFLMPPVGGSVSCYLALARKLDIDRPIYGVEAPESSGNENFETLDLPQHAAACMEALRNVQPEGPYLLGGWSLGGILAYEMARQLLEAGEEVARLILIDSYAPALLAELGGSGGESGLDVLTVFARDLIGRVGTEPLRRDDGEDVVSIEDLYRVPELAARLAGVDQERLRSRFAVFRTNMLMAEAYRPKPCSVAAKVYVATQGHPDRTRGWSGLAVSGLSIEDLPGDHYALLAEPAVERLAASLAAEISHSTV